MITIKPIEESNIFKVLNLDVFINQRECVATNAESLAEAYLCVINNGKVHPFAIFNDQEVIGFIMISYGVDDAYKNAPEIAYNNYCIWRFMIDKKYQKRGYGKIAFKLALDYIKSFPDGRANYCYLSYDPKNKVAKNLYHEFGFVETGEMDDDEIIAALKL